MNEERSDEESVRLQQLAERSAMVLNSAVRNDPEMVHDMLTEIGRHHGDDGLFEMCWAMCQVVHAALMADVPIGDGTLQGPIWAIANDLTSDMRAPVPLWAVQLLTTFVNGDQEMGRALFMAEAQDHEQLMARVATSVLLAAAAVKKAMVAELQEARVGPFSGIDSAAAEEFEGLTYRIVDAAAVYDSETATAGVGLVADRFGPEGLFSLMCGLADAVHYYGFPHIPIMVAERLGVKLSAEAIPVLEPDCAEDQWAAGFILDWMSGRFVDCRAAFAECLPDADGMAARLSALMACTGVVVHHFRELLDFPDGDPA